MAAPVDLAWVPQKCGLPKRLMSFELEQSSCSQESENFSVCIFFLTAVRLLCNPYDIVRKVRVVFAALVKKKKKKKKKIL